MHSRARIHLAIIVFFLLTLTNHAVAASLYSGTNQSDGDLTYFVITVTSPGDFTADSLGYGGSISPAVAAGGFPTSLSLYELNDSLGTQLTHDYTGGTATGPVCSNGTTEDPSTLLCEDAQISSFPLTDGTYLLTLTEQGDDGTDPLSGVFPTVTGFALAPGQNFSPGPFVDQGVPGGAQRDGDWALELSFTGTDTITSSQTPEPALMLLTGFALVAIAFRRRVTHPSTR